MRRNLVGISLFALASANSGIALAQASDDVEDREALQEEGGLNVIVVTAEKRETNLQDTPISITAVTAEGIERSGATNIASVVEAVPNIVFDTTAPISGASNATSITIRGIGQSDFALTTEAGVGTYVDGVYSSRSLGGVLDVLDIERLEVLRGPQGTLFGRNTIGGAINIISARPSGDLAGNVEASFGNQGRVHLRGSVDIPLSESLRSRISVSSKSRDGYVDTALPGANFDGILAVPPAPALPIVPPNVFQAPIAGLDNLGNENRQAVRGTLEWQASDAVRVTLFADYGRIRENNAASRLIALTGDEDAIVDGVFVPAPLRGPAVFLFNAFEAAGIPPLPGLTNSLVTDANFVTGNDTTFATAQPSGTRLDSWGVSATIDAEITDTFRVKSISAYRRTDGAFNRDADGTPFPITETHNYDYEHRQFSQEIQLIGEAIDDRLKWIVGGYFFTEQGSDPAFVDLPSSFGDVIAPVSDVDNQSYAAFAQATFDFTDALSITAGLRYTRDEKQFRADNILIVGTAGGQPGNPFFPVQPPGLVVPLVDICAIGALVGPPCPNVIRDREIQQANETFSDVSPRVSLQYKWNDDLLTYLSFSQGFKSGGFNSRYVAPVAGIRTFDPEEVTTYEAGVKFEGADRRIRINTAAYFTDYKDIQITFFEALGAPLTINGGTAEIWGGELELTALPVSNFTISAAVGYTNASYKSLIPVNPSSISTPEQRITLDSRLQNTPEWTSRIALDYVIGTKGGGEIELHADWNYTDDVFNDAQNSPFLFQPGYHIVNLGATYVEPDGRWSVRLWSDNLTNERFIQSGDSNFGLGFHEANFNRPREYGATLRFNF